MKQKREREEPCPTCNHYHDVANGEVCSICGHRAPLPTDNLPALSALPTPIVEGFLYVGSYDNASRDQVMQLVGITHILNCVPSCQVLFKNSFEYHTVSSTPPPLQECFEFIETVRAKQGKVLVHCMSGQSRAPTVVIAYLMCYKNMSLEQAAQHVQMRHQTTKLSPGDTQQLQDLARQQMEARMAEAAAAATPATLEAGVGPFGGWMQQVPPH